MKVFWITCEYAWNRGSILDSLIMLDSRIILDIMRVCLNSMGVHLTAGLDGMRVGLMACNYA
jgi:hypothetical protein